VSDAASLLLAAEIKACCAQVYASDAVRLLVGESLHPGGTALTAHLAELMGITSDSTVLDVACGRGVSAVHLAQTVGCRVIGVDYSTANVAAARQAAEVSGVGARCTFVEGDAESLALEDHSVDAVVCECALCTFPNKPRAVAEFARVARPGGRVGITDVTSTGHLPGLEDLLAWIACIADARSVDEYQGLLHGAAFHTDVIEDHSGALIRLIDTVRARLVIGTAVLSPAAVEAAGWDLRQAGAMAEAAVIAVRSGDLGYTLITAHLP